MHSMRLPDQITLTPAKTADPSDKVSLEKVIITYDANPIWRVRILPDSGEREAIYQFHNVKITADNGMQAAFSSLISHFNQKLGADNRPEGTYNLTLSDFTFHDADKATKSY